MEFKNNAKRIILKSLGKYDEKTVSVFIKLNIIYLVFACIMLLFSKRYIMLALYVLVSLFAAFVTLKAQSFKMFKDKKLCSILVVKAVNIMLMICFVHFTYPCICDLAGINLHEFLVWALISEILVLLFIFVYQLNKFKKSKQSNGGWVYYSPGVAFGFLVYFSLKRLGENSPKTAGVISAILFAVCGVILSAALAQLYLFPLYLSYKYNICDKDFGK